MKQFDVILNTDGTVAFPAYCLRTDSWYDYLAFTSDAERAVAAGDLRIGNRFFRAALTCLFSHIEAVVNAIYQQKTMPAVYRGERLCDRTRNIAQEAKKYGPVPFVSFRLEKHLRDLVAHPGISIAFSDGDSEQTMLDQSSVFERLDGETLRNLEAQISPWLDAVCRNLKVSRFTDTKRQSEQAAEFLPHGTLTNTKAYEV